MMMKKIKRIVVVSLLGFAFITLLSIHQGCKPIYQCHLLKGMSVHAFQTSTLLPVSDSVDYANLTINVNMLFDNFSCKAQNQFQLIKGAYAYKPNVIDINSDTIKSITITSDNMYDAQHPAGTSLNDLFLVQPQTDQTSNVEYYNDYRFQDLKSAPDLEDFHQLKISIQTSRSIPYDTILSPIKIKI